jgi:heme exporter protein B
MVNNSILKETWLLLKKEWLMEWRNKYALNGILLYVFATVFVVYLSFKVVGPNAWNALFWIIILFSSINAVAKSFLQESSGRTLYYYQLASAEAIILSKTIFNQLLLLLIGLVAYGFFSILVGNPIEDFRTFALAGILGALGLSSCLTMVSAISAKSGNNSTLMAVLSFPIVVPILLLLVRISKNAIDGLDFSVSVDKLVALASINVLIFALSLILFPYLWRD